MKIILSRVQFELTRRCNQECLHCCRGEAEDIDLTKEIVDAFFDNNDIYSIGDLLFSGGEPTLNGEMLEYIVDKIIEKDIPVRHFIFGINGLSYSQSYELMDEYALGNVMHQRIDEIYLKQQPQVKKLQNNN